MFNVKITFIMKFRFNIVKNVNLNPRGIACFLPFAEMYTCENIYVHSMSFEHRYHSLPYRAAYHWC